MLKLHKPNILLLRVRILAVIFVIVGMISGMDIAQADQYDAQIQSLQSQNNSSQAQVDSLANQAASYQAEIDQLSAQISALQSAISLNQAKEVSLQQQILSDQQKITQNKAYLSDAIQSLYEDGQMTTIEELATSKSLSDYVDKQTYNTTVQNKVNSLIQQIGSLEAQAQQQKTQLDIVVKVENQQAGQLASAQAQQQQMLAYNQQQQDAYNAQIASNQSQISQLRQEQAAANRRLDSSGQVVTSGSCGGSYPASAISPYGGRWGCDYSLDDALDNFAMYNRECVSYTAWMVYKTYGYSPVGFGDANQWPAHAENAGIAVGSTPKVGSVAIYMGNASTDPWGHAMWVEGVSGDQIHVFSYNDGFDGNFYDHWVSALGLTYIYFGG
ncbi:MAG TPA: CHAP domain-containing protein [Candidatus Saccharimonadales bacterium]|nr:CHAP domain-containing protein [Candidatus Saccharimonadales bacterium]